MAARNRRKKIEPRLVCGFAVLNELLMLASIRGVMFGQKNRGLLQNAPAVLNFAQ
jgi:hypothetical protein